MDVTQLLFQFWPVVDFERIVLGLPEPVSLPKVREILSRVLPIPLPPSNAGSAFPTVHEGIQLAHFWEPDQGVDMVRHHHKADTRGQIQIQDFIEPAKQDTFRLAMVEQLAALVDGKCDEVNVQLVVNDSPVLAMQ